MVIKSSYQFSLEQLKEEELRLERVLEAANNGGKPNKRLINKLQNSIKMHKNIIFREQIKQGIMLAPVEFNSEDYEPMFSNIKMSVAELELYCAMHGYWFNIEIRPKS